MVERRKSIGINDAINKVMEIAKVLTTLEVPLEESDGFYLAHPIIADHDVPPFDRSPYDGYAIVSEDTLGASFEKPTVLEVIETIGAGQIAFNKVSCGTAIRIMTGAQLPEGADAIVKLETVKERLDGECLHIILTRSIKKGTNISQRGEDISQGNRIISAGLKITAGVKAVLATFGYKKVEVYRKPKVGVLATGSELLEISEPMSPGKIRNSNSPMILSQIRQAGGIPVDLGKVSDGFDSSLRKIKESIEHVDILVTTGGVSVGDFDHLPAVYRELGAEVLFNKIAMRPGSVTTVAKKENTLLFGLSGNPSACFVGFELLTAPYIKTIQGASKPFMKKAKAILSHDFPKVNPVTRFVRCQMDFEEHNGVKAIGLDKSSSIYSLAQTNALMILPGGTRDFRKGDTVEVLLLQSDGSASLTFKERVLRDHAHETKRETQMEI